MPRYLRRPDKSPNTLWLRPRAEHETSGLTLPATVRTTLAALAQPLPGVAWTRPDQLHVTLRFLGEVPAGKLDAITTGLAAVRVSAFVLPGEPPKIFPTSDHEHSRILQIYLQDRPYEGVHNDFSDFEIGNRPAARPGA